MIDEDRGSVGDDAALPEGSDEATTLSNVPAPEMVEKKRLDGMMSAYQRVLAQNQAMEKELTAQRTKLREVELADLPDEEANVRRRLAEREDALREREAALEAMAPQAEANAKSIILAQIADQFKVDASDLIDCISPEEAVRLARKLATFKSGSVGSTRKAQGADDFEGGPVAPTPKGKSRTREEIVEQFKGSNNVFGFRRALREAGLGDERTPLSIVL